MFTSMVKAIQDGQVTREHVDIFKQNANGLQPAQAVTSLRNRYRSEWKQGELTIAHVDAPRRQGGQEYYVKSWLVEDASKNTLARCDGQEYYIVRSSDGHVSVWSETELSGLDREILSGPFGSRWEATDYRNNGAQIPFADAQQEVRRCDDE